MSTQRPTLPDALDFYAKLLKSLGVEADAQGLLTGVDAEGNESPVSIEGEGGATRLVLPTQDNLRQTNWSGMTVFHPLSESVYQGESLVIKKLKRHIVTRLNISTVLLFTELLQLACTPEKHAKLTTKQTKLLDQIPKPDEKTFNDITRVVRNIGKTPENHFSTLYLKHGGRYRGEECSRLGVVSFPIIEQLDDAKKREVFGVKLRVDDFKAMKNLFYYIFPNANVAEEYNYGVLSEDNSSAPYFKALIGTYLKMAQALNSKSWLFRKHLEDFDDIYIPLDWENHLGNLEAYRELIPPMDGNINGPMPTEPQAPQEATSSPAGKLAWSDVLNRLNAVNQPPTPQPQPQYAYPQEPQHPPWLGGPATPAPQPPPQQPQVPAGHYANDPRLQPQFPWMGHQPQQFPGQPPQMPWGGQPLQGQQFPQQQYVSNYGQPSRFR